MANIVIGSTIEQISTRIDGSVTVKIATGELPNESVGTLFSFRGKFCKVLISDNEIIPVVKQTVDRITISDISRKNSKSQRLRNVLFMLHTQNGGTNENFNDYYNSTMEQLISHFKNKLQ